MNYMFITKTIQDLVGPLCRRPLKMGHDTTADQQISMLDSRVEYDRGTSVGGVNRTLVSRLYSSSKTNSEVIPKTAFW